ncbi:hypothetical protein GGI05_001511 [Coemansia sp. RSA 2603]|nr:hypothetical protein GGI05_001511 [Coemansia sp. RSA 2603]
MERNVSDTLLEFISQEDNRWQAVAEHAKKCAEDEAAKNSVLKTALEVAQDSLATLKVTCTRETLRADKEFATVLSLKSELESVRQSEALLKVSCEDKDEQAKKQAAKIAKLVASLRAAQDTVSSLKDSCEREKRRADQIAATISKPKSILKSCCKKKVSFKVDDDSSTGVAEQASESLLPADLGSATTLQPAVNSLGNGTSLNIESSLQVNPGRGVAPQPSIDSFTGVSNQATQSSLSNDSDSTAVEQTASDSVVVVRDQDQATILVSSIDGAAALQTGIGNIFSGISQYVEPSLLANLSSEEALLLGAEIHTGKDLQRIEPTLEAISGIEMAPQLSVDARANGSTQGSEPVLEVTCNSSSSLEASSISKRKIAKVRARRVKNQPTDLPAAHGILPTPSELDAIGAHIWEDYLRKTSANAMAPPLGIDGHAGGTATVLDLSVQAHFSNSALMQPSSVSLTGVSDNNLNVFFQSFSDSTVTELSDTNTPANQRAMELGSTAPTNLENAAALQPSASSSASLTNHALESFIQSIANGAMVPQTGMANFASEAAFNFGLAAPNNLDGMMALQPNTNYLTSRNCQTPGIFPPANLANTAQIQPGMASLDNETAMDVDLSASTNLNNAAALQTSMPCHAAGETKHPLEPFFQIIANGAVVPQQTMDSLGGASAMDLDTLGSNNLGNTVAPQPDSDANVGLSDAEMAVFIKTFVVGTVTLQPGIDSLSGDDSQCVEPFHQANSGNVVAPHLGVKADVSGNTQGLELLSEAACASGNISSNTAI